MTTPAGARAVTGPCAGAWLWSLSPVDLEIYIGLLRAALGEAEGERARREGFTDDGLDDGRGGFDREN